MRYQDKTVGFGMIVGSRHYHQVTIGKSAVCVEEVFQSGIVGGEVLETIIVPRALVSRSVWGEIADAAEQSFNHRLQGRKLRLGAWRPVTLLDRLLGKELLVLMWAAEQARTKAEIWHIIHSWQDFSPEERWWLATETAAATGKPGQRTGWRAALYWGLSGRDDTLDMVAI